MRGVKVEICTEVEAEPKLQRALRNGNVSPVMAVNCVYYI